MPVMNIRGVNINYEVIGDSGPWLALTTGGRRGYAEFIAFARKIAAHGFRVVLHDRRNTGASDVVIENGANGEGEEELCTDDLVLLLGNLHALPAFIGGTSSGARMSMLVYLRHPQAVRALLLMRVTGGDFAAGRLPEMYYGQFIRAAREGGMRAVCATEQYQERIKANPANQNRLMAMDPAHYISVMSYWLDCFLQGPRKPVLGVTDEALRSIAVPTMVVPGNDKTHAASNGHATAALIPGSVVFSLPIEDQDVPLLPFSDWAPHEALLAKVFAEFMCSVMAAPQAVQVAKSQKETT
jgi:pimeloyl-ACP methyl ester carboxylesterase